MLGFLLDSLGGEGLVDRRGLGTNAQSGCPARWKRWLWAGISTRSAHRRPRCGLRACDAGGV